MLMSSLRLCDIFWLHFSSALDVHIILAIIDHDIKYKEGNGKFSGLVSPVGNEQREK